MIFSGLKFKIGGTLLVLLFIAVAIGNLMVAFFWQKGLVRLELENCRAVLENAISDNSNGPLFRGKTSPGDLETLCRSAGMKCAGMVFFNGQQSISYSRVGGSDYFSFPVKKAVDSQREAVELDGNIWGTGSAVNHEKSYLLVVESIDGTADPDGRTMAIGMAVQFPSVGEVLGVHKKTALVYLFVNVLILCIVGFFRMVNLVVKPLEKMVELSESYPELDSLPFGEEQRRSEFGRLSASFNNMIMRIEMDREKLREAVSSLELTNKELQNTQKEMVRTEKLASVGRLSAGLAHEIGNPIGIVQGYVELLQSKDIKQSEREQFTERALKELDRVSTLIRRLLDFSRSSTGKTALVNLKSLFQELEAMLRLQADKSGIQLYMDIEEDFYVNGDGEGLRQVFLNCMINSVDALEAAAGDTSAIIRVTAEKKANNGGNNESILIKIEDNGVGIDQENMGALFDPFFTTKEPGKGTGLGLFVSHSIIDAHGGAMWMESASGAEGAVVCIKLPAIKRELEDE